MLKLSEKGYDLIRVSEGLNLESYPDTASVWTIGYGTTTLNGAPVEPGMVINKLVAIALLQGKIQEYLDFIEKVVTVKLNQNQIDALTSFVYNIGKHGFADSSLLKAINAKMVINEDLFTRWNKVRVNGVLTPSKGLTDRRKREYKLFIEKENL